MNWELSLARAAQRALRVMPQRDRDRIIRALDDMKSDPLAGDITALRGEYRELYRRRIGSWRSIFALKTDRRAVLVGDTVRGERFWRKISRSGPEASR
jgi:mRNA-degrading endonuclease RelE of RelBE toxin-antitoxin system